MFKNNNITHKEHESDNETIIVESNIPAKIDKNKVSSSSISKSDFIPKKSQNLQSTGCPHKNKYLELNNDDFQFILFQITSKDDPIFCQLRSKYQINKCDSTLFSAETKRNIILDYIFNKSKSKALSDIAYNRYIFCLNMINEKRVVTANDLKQFILTDLEKEIGFTIDKKTIKNLLVKMEELELIKIIEFELTMKNKNYNYLNNKDVIKQNKMVLTRRDVLETDDLIKNIEEVIKPQQKNYPKVEVDESLIKTGSDLHKDNNNESIIQEIDNIVNKFNLKITSYHRKVMKFFEIMDNLYYIRRERLFGQLFNRFAENCFVRKNLEHFEEYFITKINKKIEYNKDITINYEDNTSTEHLQKIVKTFSNEKVIVPQFMIKNLYKENFSKNNNESMIQPNEDDNSLIKILEGPRDIKEQTPTCEKNFFKLMNMANELIRKLITELGFKEKCNTLIEDYDSLLLGNKRKKEDYWKLEDQKDIDNPIKQIKKKSVKITNKFKRYIKIIDLKIVLSRIISTPKITFKRLFTSVFNILPSEEVTKEFLKYFKKTELIRICNKSSNNNDIADDSTLEINNDIVEYLDNY